MGQVVAVPLKSTRVFHPQWERHHIPVAEGGMTGTIQILRPDLVGSRDKESGRTDFAEPTLIYEGPARIQAKRTGEPDINERGHQVVISGQYLVCVENDCPEVLVKDLVKVMALRQGNASFVGQIMDVIDATNGTHVWDRYLGCNLQQSQNRGNGGV